MDDTGCTGKVLGRFTDSIELFGKLGILLCHIFGQEGFYLNKLLRPHPHRGTKTKMMMRIAAGLFGTFFCSILNVEEIKVPLVY